MSETPESLALFLAAGMKGATDEESRRPAGLDLAPDAGDLEIARAVARAATLASTSRVTVDADHRTDPRRALETAPVPGADSSFLGRLEASPDSPGLAVEHLDDVRTLLCVVRAGTLRQRRAAVARLSDRLVDAKGVPSDDVHDATDALIEPRDVELAYERSAARARLSGARGREARQERATWDELAASAEQAIRTFWDQGSRDEPIAALSGIERAQLLLRVRDLPDIVVAHLAALVEGTDGVGDRASRQSLLAALRYAGDPRLLPSLVSVLEGPDSELVTEAARALAGVQDVRARPSLLAAFDRSVHDVQRVTLAGALGAHGDVRGAGYVREQLETKDDDLLVATLDALATTGGAEDSEAVARFLDHDNPLVATSAARALARLGDARVLGHLSEAARRARSSALRAELEDATAAIHARLELRGEEVSEAGHAMVPAEPVGVVISLPFMVRLRAWKDFVVGHVWLFFGGLDRAVRRYEAAASKRSDWGAPYIAMAFAHLRRDQHALALAAFRRSIETDRAMVERNPLAIRRLTRTFLLRAEEVERDGRIEIARGLLEEVRALDLRRLSSALRVELDNRFDALRRRRSAS